MGMVQTVKRTVNSFWQHGDDDEDDYQEDDNDYQSSNDRDSQRDTQDRDSSRETREERTTYRPVHSGGSGSGRRMSGAVPLPLRGREKNIYTLKPKTQEEASIAADYLKTGSAIVLNLDDVERMTAVRIIDFMSGVCYGLEHQGHAMKLGDTIFLFTPGDFEISSDESDYGENTEFFFKEISQTDDEDKPATPALEAKTPERSAPHVISSSSTTSIGAPHVERISERPAIERVAERPTIERPSVERPTLPRAWER